MSTTDLQIRDRLLADVHHGRLGVVDARGVYVVPVGFVWHDGAIWFHSAGGRKTAALDGDPACVFEVDTYDKASADWASVMLRGRARMATPDEVADVMSAFHARFGHVLRRVVGRGGGGQIWRISILGWSARAGP